MLKKILLIFVGLGAAGIVAIYLLTIPLLRRLPKPGRVSMDGITTIDDAVEACWRTHLQGWDLVAYAQNLADSPFMTKLNKGPDTVPGPRYVVLGTKYDDIATPYDSVFLKGPNVTNILLQDVCNLDYIDHLAASYDSIALHLVLNALDPAHATKPDCHPVLPAMGG